MPAAGTLIMIACPCLPRSSWPFAAPGCARHRTAGRSPPDWHRPEALRAPTAPARPSGTSPGAADFSAGGRYPASGAPACVAGWSPPHRRAGATPSPPPPATPPASRRRTRAETPPGPAAHPPGPPAAMPPMGPVAQLPGTSGAGATALLSIVCPVAPSACVDGRTNRLSPQPRPALFRRGRGRPAFGTGAEAASAPGGEGVFIPGDFQPP